MEFLGTSEAMSSNCSSNASSSAIPAQMQMQSFHLPLYSPGQFVPYMGGNEVIKGFVGKEEFTNPFSVLTFVTFKCQCLQRANAPIPASGIGCRWKIRGICWKSTAAAKGRRTFGTASAHPLTLLGAANASTNVLPAILLAPISAGIHPISG